MPLRYDLDKLGWFDFEQLCQSILKSLFGPAVIAWGGRGDHGRDAYTSESLPIIKGGPKNDGPFVFQVKFVENANAAGAKPADALLHAVRQEAAAIVTRLANDEWDDPNYYILLTNTVTSAELRGAVETELQKALPDCNVLCWGGTDVSGMLDSAPRVREAFPQLLGLRDLKALIAEAMLSATLERSRSQLDKAARLATVFSPTAAYFAAQRVLHKHNFVVLTGPPEMGKTSIGLIIALGCVTEGWRFFDCTQPNDLLEARAGEGPMIFFVDDAFGSTEYRPDLAQPWGDQLERVLGRLDAQHRLIWTSRPAPLHAAIATMNLEGNAEHFPKPAEVMVDASRLTIPEKAMILYRHAKAAGLEHVAKKILLKNILTIVQNDHFTPERIRRFVTEVLPSLAAESDAAEKLPALLSSKIKAEIETPTTRMRKSFENLNTKEKTFLLSLLDAPKGSISTEFAEAAAKRHLAANSVAEVQELTSLLGDHFIRVTTKE